jgi:hypothetical protein
MAFTINDDHIYIDLLESAPFNLGKRKLYEGVSGNLVAYACKISFQKGFEGYVSFTAKTKLIDHYAQTLNAQLFGGQLMVINKQAANILIDKYFKTHDMGYVKEPEGIDFVIQGKPLTVQQKQALSEYIKADKKKQAQSKTANKKSIKYKQLA